MSVHNLDKLLKPRRIALIGANNEPANAGLGVLRNLLAGGFQGVVYPVNPDREAVRGIPTYRDVASLPKTPDLAVICTPAEQVPGLVEACGHAGVGGILIVSDGFRESSEAGKVLEHKVAEIAQRYDKLRVLGPNSLGFIAPSLGLNVSHAVAQPKAGRIAFISQSRALSNSVLDWAADKGVGISYFVSTGNMVDVSFGDLIDYFGADAETRAIILYVQSIEHARRFMSAARAFARSKPIVVYKPGRFRESAQVAASHTGAMIAEDAVYEAAFQRAGVVRVADVDDMFDVAELLASQRLPKGARLCIVGNAGGPAVIAADALMNRGGQLADLREDTCTRLDALLPCADRCGNPVDLLDDASPERFESATEIILEDADVDALLVICAPSVATDPTAIAQAVVTATQRSRKPVLAAWMGGNRAREGVQALSAADVPTHGTPEQAVRAFMHLVSYARNLEALYETPRHVPLRFNFSRRKARKQLIRLLEGRDGRIDEIHARTFLRAYGIPITPTVVADSETDAIGAAERTGYPVVLKVLMPEVMHKVDIGGVALDLKSAEEVRGAYHRILRRTGEQGLDTQLRGVTIQPMMDLRQGVEMILGAKKDPTFGAVIMVGMGGIATSVIRDRALGLPPINERHARRMLESLKLWPMLAGFRGQPAVNLDLLVEVIIRFSLLIIDFSEIKEIDINPLLVTPTKVSALDAGVILERPLAKHPSGGYEHLAIRPYPDECVRRTTLRDGTSVTLRPIRAEDEPQWHELVSSSSAESIRLRFRSLFKTTTHQMAVQHCVIDYERDLAIVAEVETDDARQLVGVAQLASDTDRETAEFAVLVPDPWQGKGVGHLLLEVCIELARQWGIKRIVAETDPENSRMLSAFHKQGFSKEVNLDDDVVYLEKQIGGSAAA